MMACRANLQIISNSSDCVATQALRCDCHEEQFFKEGVALPQQ